MKHNLNYFNFSPKKTGLPSKDGRTGGTGMCRDVIQTYIKNK